MKKKFFIGTAIVIFSLGTMFISHRSNSGSFSLNTFTSLNKAQAECEDCVTNCNRAGDGCECSCWLIVNRWD